MASIRKNTASQHISFCLVNASNGAALTGATFTSKAWVSKDGTQSGFAGTFTELGNGQYDYSPSQSETNCTSFGITINPTSSIPVNLQLFTDNWDTTAAVLTSGSGTAQIAVSGGAVTTVTTVTNQLTAGAIATGVWQDSTAGDFTVASSIGKSLYTGNVVPGGAGGLFIAGSNAATTVNFTGNLSGSVGSVTAGVTVTTNNDKSGYSLTQAFPANFSSLGINGAGKISGVVLTDTLTTYTGNTPQTGDFFATSIAEASSVPASNASAAAKLAWLALLGLNKITQTSTQMKVRNSGDSSDVGTSATSDDGTTATRGAFA